MVVGNFELVNVREKPKSCLFQAVKIILDRLVNALYSHGNTVSAPDLSGKSLVSPTEVPASTLKIEWKLVFL
jgi:hypothetical protein